MTSTKMHERLRNDAKPSLFKAAQFGFWFCERCRRVSFMDMDNDEPAICPHCRHRDARWHPPVLPKCD